MTPTPLERIRKIRQDKSFQIRKSHLLRDQIEIPGKGLRPFQLRTYQQQMVFHLLISPRFVVGDDVGTGKTVSTAGALAHLWEKNPALKVLICTTKSTAEQWKTELNRFFHKVNVFVAAGDAAKRAKQRENFVACSEYAVLVYTYGSIARDFSEVQNWAGYLLIADEATAFKESKAQIHQVMEHVSRQAARAWGLTATLIRNNLYEGYGILRVISPGVFSNSPSKFIQQYCLTQLVPIGRGRKVPKIIGYAPDQVEAFKEAIEPHYLGRSKREVASDLPPVIPIEIPIHLSQAEWDLYREALAGTLQVGQPDPSGVKPTVTKMSVLIRCQQVVNHPGLVESDLDSSKLQILMEYLTEGDLQDQQVIIFSRFKQLVVNHLEPALQARKVPVCRITGDENTKEREENKLKFQSGQARVILITSAGGEGINLQAASVIVFYDTPWSAGEYVQIIGRMCRIGSEHERVVAIHLVAKPPQIVRAQETIDGYTMQVLQKKVDLFEKVLDRKVHDRPFGQSDQISGPTNPEYSEMDQIFGALIADAGRARS